MKVFQGLVLMLTAWGLRFGVLAAASGAGAGQGTGDGSI